MKPSNAHDALTVIEEDGEEVEILRQTLPYGDVSGEPGTYFIAYARTPHVPEEMLASMIVGRRRATTTGCSTSATR